LKKNSGELKAIIYTGPSMNPTLKNLDKLFYAPYKDSIIKRGDIVVFFDPEKRIKVIHRVKYADSRGIITIGDNNSKPDTSILHPDQIIGQIIYGERYDSKIRIYNGFPGIVQAMHVRLIKKIRKYLHIILKPPYYLLSGKLKLPLRKRVLTFQRPEGKELQLVIGNMVVARRIPGDDWQIRPPFRLFIDEDSLPREGDSSI
jgi:signal peptidase I